jgi:opacity protein-like surface antigen
MLNTRKRANHFLLTHIVIILFTLFVTSSSLAQNKHNNRKFLNAETPWHAVISLGSGAAITSSIGSSQTFPIANPVVDQFYIYTNNRPAQTGGLLDSFVGVEWAFHSNWAMQMGLSYNQTWDFKAQGSLLQGADAQSVDQYSYQYSIITRQLLAESKLLYRFKERYLPYVLLGLGAAFNTASNYTTTVPPFLTFTRQYNNNTQTSFSYALGMGMDVQMIDNFRFGLGYRFADLGRIKLGKAIIDTNNAGGTLSQSHLYAHEVLAQITWML